jgi:16S rRNA C967 or C1407 C5-methylase (RsmB/RsmF family)
MHQSDRVPKLSGAQGFDSYYASVFGSRWPALKSSLGGEPLYAEWKAGGSESYFLDSASIRAAAALPLEGALRILDLCAAPGGKTLVLASRMEKDAVLVSNERSPERKLRLSRVCDSCLSEDVRARVKVTCSDGSRWCTEQTECYDRILLDAPCSSERHVLSDPKYLAQWSPARIRTVVTEQWALLSSAFRLLVPGGYLVYSTCALCPDENDGVIEKLIKKFGEQTVSVCTELPDTQNTVMFCSAALPEAERTEHGFHILPDVQNGAGPIFYTLIRKN